MELSFILYIFAAFIIIPGTFFILSTMNKVTAGIIASIGMLIMFTLFGIQYYNLDGTKKQEITPIEWPPSINVCPDYLTLYSIPGASGETLCVDTVGAGYDNSSISIYKPSEGSQPVENQQFHLYLRQSDIDAYKSANSGKPFDRKSILIEQCKTKKVTWEGIWDGIQQHDGIPPIV
jgi:hypothetical protein